MLDLEEKKRLNIAGKVANTVVNGYPYGMSSTEMKQKIKILRMEFESCRREQ
jgi:hypothetical protein